MQFDKRMKIRLYTAIVMGVIGIALIVLGFVLGLDMASPFGLMFFVIGIARTIQYIRIMKNSEIFKKAQVAEEDERNVLIWTKARSLAFSVYVIVAAVAVVVLYLCGLDVWGQAVSYSLFGFVLIYWVCYFIISRKY